MKGVVLLIMLSVVYVCGNLFFRKKGKLSVWNTLVFGVVVFFLTFVFSPNYLLRLPNFKNTNSVMALVFAGVPSIIIGYYGKYEKENKVYKWNVWFLRPVVLELGFTGLAMPYLHTISFMGKMLDVGIMMVSVGMLLVAVVQAVLNIIDKELRMVWWKQLIYDMVILCLNMALVLISDSVWLALIPRGLYAISRAYGGYRLRYS